MPRNKLKSIGTHTARKIQALCRKTKPRRREEEHEQENIISDSIREENESEILQLPQPSTVAPAPNLQEFAYNSPKKHRPHIKIQYESDPSPQREESKGLWEPPNWREFLANLRKMRANNDAPVDSMGCHMSMDANAPPEVIRYQSLISLMLSSQTKDQVTFAAMERLRAKGLTVDNVLKMDDDELGKLIYPVGFWKTKIKYIKKTTQTLKEQYNGDIPDSVEKLCKLTGVGPKMAHICMKVAWNKVTGIGVDTHVHRISNRIGWVKKPTSTPEDTRKSLQTWLPFDLWSEVNHLMVGFGQTICLPIGPLCHECLNHDICPSKSLGRKSPKKTPSKSPKDVKVENVLQVKKELVLDEESVLPERKTKVSPKKIKQEVDDDFEVKKEYLSVETVTKKTSPVKKRKVTPKKDKEAVVDDFEVKKENLSVETVTKKTSPNKKRKVTPKKEEKENSDDDFEDTKSDKVLHTVAAKVPARAKSAKGNKNMKQTENNEVSEVKKRTRSAKK